MCRFAARHLGFQIAEISIHEAFQHGEASDRASWHEAREMGSSPIHYFWELPWHERSVGNPDRMNT